MAVLDGREVASFAGSTSLVKMDILFDAGTAVQPQMLCAGAANKLLTVATEKMNADELAEFLDFRGVVVEPGLSPTQSSLTVYMLRRLADEVVPVVADMLCRPLYAEEDFRLWQASRRQELSTLSQRTSHIARKMFFETLFGTEHPLGRYAMVDDVDLLQLDTIKDFWRRHYGMEGCSVVLSGCVDDGLLSLTGKYFGRQTKATKPVLLSAITKEGTACRKVHHMESATQTSLRIGRVLPLRWDEPDYARLMLLVNILGGYFGSRLMSNLREDKGFTYGVRARTQIFSGVIVFYIVADVAAGTAEAAVEETRKELRRLCEEPIGDDELDLAKTVLAGDFLRSVDGVFELSARYCDMLGAGIDERLTDNIRAALKETTAAQLQELAQRLLDEGSMTICLAGV